MKLVFIHGWGFDDRLWRDVIRLLPDHETQVLELGFLGEALEAEPVISPDTVIVGHSLGVMWALKHLPAHPRALISLCGFDRFSPPVPRQTLITMKQGLVRNANAQLRHFRRGCGISRTTGAENLNEERLLEGLDWLQSWDARPERALLNCPVHALAARDDAIVPPVMSTAIWGETIEWAGEGGHALPLTRPDWCAEKIAMVLEAS